MIRRLGFVSNSSSSSFIVATKNDTRVTIELEVDLSDYGNVLETEEEVINYFLDEYSYYNSIEELLEDEDELLKIKYLNIIEAIGKDKIVVIGHFDSDGEPEEVFLYENGIPESDNIEIIYDEM